MKTFTAEAYNKKTKRYEVCLVSYRYSSLNGKVDILEVKGKDGDIKGVIEPSHLQAIRKEAEKLSQYLTHAERVEMMNEISNEYRI